MSNGIVDEIGNRIKAFREKLGIGQRELARRLNMHQATLSKIERGEMDVISPYLPMLAKGLKVTEAQLAGFDANVEPVRINGRLVPVLDYIQAGAFAGVAPYFRDEEMTDFIPTMGGHSENTFALRVRGESMMPEFREGDIVVIDPEIAPQPEDFVVGKDQGGEATFKRYHRRGVDPNTGNIRFDLVPLNPAYETLHSTEQHIEIVGTMVEHHRYRRR
ncbi:LexA family protein [Terriglobus sp. ADX1]|uniref:LexA family protein n=1 Tax=Terriglobus sp. ADX1 TaxID=2794063 RepID=UPI002FE692C0